MTSERPPPDARDDHRVAVVVVETVATAWASHTSAGEIPGSSTAVPLLRDHLLTEWFEGMTPSHFIGPLHTSFRLGGDLPPASVHTAIAGLDRPMFYLLGVDATMGKLHDFLESDDFENSAASSGMDGGTEMVKATVTQLMSTALANAERDAKLDEVSAPRSGIARTQADWGPTPPPPRSCARYSSGTSAPPPTKANTAAPPRASVTPKGWSAPSARA